MAAIKKIEGKKQFPFALIIGLVAVAAFLAFLSVSDFSFSGGSILGGTGSGLSGGINLPPVSPPVTVTPLIAVTNLQVLGTPGQRAIALGFELPCNRDESPDCAKISDYEVRWRTDTTITSNNFDSAYIGAKYCESQFTCLALDQQTEKEVIIDKAIGGGPSGGASVVLPSRLMPDTTYYLAVRYLVDDHWSPISNVVIATTAEAPPSICAGNARGCDSYALEPSGQALCIAQNGCTWNANGLLGQKCTGTATACSAITDDLACGEQAGCKWHVDNDRDAFYSDVDCNDNDADVKPNRTEVCGNSIDDNCNGKIDSAEDSCKETVGVQTNQTTDTGGDTNNIIQDTTGSGGGTGGTGELFPRTVEGDKTNKKITNQILDADGDSQITEEDNNIMALWLLLLLVILIISFLAYYKYIRPELMQRNKKEYAGYKEY